MLRALERTPAQANALAARKLDKARRQLEEAAREVSEARELVKDGGQRTEHFGPLLEMLTQAQRKVEQA